MGRPAGAKNAISSLSDSASREPGAITTRGPAALAAASAMARDAAAP
jgi:hypothetical protein